jgi:hypothetical protein
MWTLSTQQIATAAGGFAGPSAAAPPETPAATTTAAAAEGQLDLADGQLATQQEIVDAMRQKGIKLDKTFTKGQIVPAFEDAFYKALQKALFEYWLYSATDEQIQPWMKYFKEHGVTKLNPEDVIDKSRSYYAKQYGLEPTATGGLVKDVMGGVANIIRPAPGEGLAYVGPGERILPAGSGGAAPGSRNTLAITVDVSGQQGADFNRYLENAIRNAIYDYESRKRLT